MCHERHRRIKWTTIGTTGSRRQEAQLPISFDLSTRVLRRVSSHTKGVVNSDGVPHLCVTTTLSCHRPSALVTSSRLRAVGFSRTASRLLSVGNDRMSSCGCIYYRVHSMEQWPLRRRRERFRGLSRLISTRSIRRSEKDLGAHRP